MPRGGDDDELNGGMPAPPVAGAAVLPEPIELPPVAWWEPNEFLNEEAALFAELFDLHQAVATRVLKDPQEPLPGEDYFDERQRFYYPDAQSVKSPEDTVPGMRDAGRLVAKHIDDGHKIAVFTDYDPDGLCGAEALRLALEPYLTRKCDACKGRGRIKGEDCAACDGIGDVYDPDRIMIGYASASSGFGGGMDEFALKAAEAGCKLFITVDCGSKSIDAIQAAKDAGMDTIVADHHDVGADNPATFHLNPQQYDPPTSSNTGAQLAWKLGMSVQEAIDGNESPEHWQRAMYLAAFGCRADAGDVTLPENRAFFWLPIDAIGEDAVPPGIAAVAEALGEDASNPGNVILTSACLNLGKRTPRVGGERVARIIAAKNAEDVADDIAWLLEEYERAKPIKNAMIDEALDVATQRKEELERQADLINSTMEILTESEQLAAKRAQKVHKQLRAERALPEDERDAVKLEELEMQHEQLLSKLHPLNRIAGESPEEERFAHVVLDKEEYDEYPGYAGIVASRISKNVGKPTIIFAKRDTDEHGNDTFKWSIRNESRVTRRMGELLRTEPYFGDKIKIAKDDPRIGVERNPNTGEPYQEGDPDFSRIATVTLNARDRMAENVKAVHEASSVVYYDPDGDVERYEPSIGGHEMVVSGACSRERIPEVIKALETWAESCNQRGAGGWKIKPPYSGPSAFLTARQASQPGMSHVAPEELDQIEEQSLRLGPFSPWDEHRPPAVGLIGTIKDLTLDDESGHYKGRITMPREDGKGEIEREAWVSHRSIDRVPADGRAEWVFNVDGTNSYFMTEWRTDSLESYDQSKAKTKSK